MVQRRATAILTRPHSVVVIALDDAGCMLAYPGDDLGRGRPIVDQITEHPDLVEVILPSKDLGLDRVERIDIRMNVGQNQGSHRAPHESKDSNFGNTSWRIHPERHETLTRCCSEAAASARPSLARIVAVLC